MPAYPKYERQDTVTVEQESRRRQTVADIGPSPCAVEDALNSQETFTRAQVAWLMSEAYRWGYEARVDEENGAWPEASVFSAGETINAIERKQLRNEADAASRLPRPGDFLGRRAAERLAAA